MKHTFTPYQHGFTLIEIIGVLAVMSILAATIAPSAIQMITSSKQTAEDSALIAINDSLRLFVQRNKKVPNETTWSSDLATLLNTSPTKVATNGNSGERIYLYPDNFIATGNTLLYDQYSAVALDATAGSISNLPTS
ncbi:MAG: type II secretion system protein, partial [Mariprofundales bacterium]|nr:type II secretion system protein [Mariprofundales bacterium]